VAIIKAMILDIISLYSLVRSFRAPRLWLVALFISFVSWRFFVWNTLHDAFLNFFLVSGLIVVQFHRVLSRLALSLLGSRQRRDSEGRRGAWFWFDVRGIWCWYIVFA
jgi:hypothetical protein